MRTGSLKDRVSKRTARFLIAILSVVAVALVDMVIKSLFRDYVPMSLFLAPVVFSAWIGGRLPGLVATILGGLLEVFLFSRERFLTPPAFIDVLRISVYLVEGIAISFVFGKLYKSNRFLKEQDIFLNSSLREAQKDRQHAEHASDSKSIFLANMSHEIRNPLSAIIGYIDLLKENDLSSEERHKYLLTMEKTALDLTTIINDVLDLSKVEAGHLDISDEPFSLNGLMNEIKAIFGLQCEQKHLLLKIEPVGVVPNKISADFIRLKQIVINLVSNAIKFTATGEVKVSYEVQNDFVIIKVTDTGIGLSQKQQSVLFKDFKQADESIHRKFSGTGLGLSLSRKLAKRMGGDVLLLKSAPNQGSTFCVKVSYRPVKESLLDRSPVKQGLTAGTENRFFGKRALVVDDSLDNRFLLSRVLEKMGLQVMTAANGQEALDVAETTTFDVIFMDMQMPVMDGYEAVKKLKERNCPSLIVALTASAMKQDREKCLQAGCETYITKPVQKESLIEILQQT